MGRPTLYQYCALVCVLSFAGCATELVQQKPVRLVVQLVDGSRVVGQPCQTSLSLVSETLGKVELPLTRIVSVQISKETFAASVVLCNGDKVSGTLAGKTLSLVTLFGGVTIPVSKITGFKVSLTSGTPAELAKGLVLYYSFDTDDDQIARDQSGNGNDGRIFGATHVPNGISGTALSFNGYGDYVRVPNSKSLQSQTFTVAAWAQTRELVSRTPDRGIIGKLRVEVNHDRYLIRQHGDSIGCGVGDGGVPPEAKSKLFVDTWGAVVLTFDGAVARYYVNGELVGRRDGVEYRGNDLDLIIGADGFQSSSDQPQWFWNGMIDEVRIYNRALSAKEVLALYETTAPTAGR